MDQGITIRSNVYMEKAIAKETTSIHTLSATKRVLGTIELLEAIFLQCDIVDLLCNAQRICKTWNALIKTSVQIQQKLFYTQTSPDTPNCTQHINPIATLYLPLKDPTDTHNEPGTYTPDVELMSSSKAYKKLLNRPEGVEKCSWEDMYPTSQMCGIRFEGSGAVLKGGKTKLGRLVRMADTRLEIRRLKTEVVELRRIYRALQEDP